MILSAHFTHALSITFARKYLRPRENLNVDQETAGTSAFYSSKTARETYIPMLKNVIKGDKKYGKALSEKIGLDKDEIKFLAK